MENTSWDTKEFDKEFPEWPPKVSKVKSFISRQIALAEERGRVDGMQQAHTMLDNWVSHDKEGDEFFSVEDTHNLYLELNKRISNIINDL